MAWLRALTLVSEIGMAVATSVTPNDLPQSIGKWNSFAVCATLRIERYLLKRTWYRVACSPRGLAMHAVSSNISEVQTRTVCSLLRLDGGVNSLARLVP